MYFLIKTSILEVTKLNCQTVRYQSFFLSVDSTYFYYDNDIILRLENESAVEQNPRRLGDAFGLQRT